MKNVISILVLSLVLAITVESSAQIIGIKGGLNLSNMLEKEDGENYSDDNSIKPGFHIGATAEIPYNQMLSFETGLLLSTKGFKRLNEGVDWDGESYRDELTVNLIYLDIPLTAKVLHDLGEVKIYGLFGPSLGLGLNGKYIATETWRGETETYEEDLEFGSDEDEDTFKRLDFGFILGAGIEINGIQLGISYNLGLANISHYSSDEYKFSNRVFAISVGYKIREF